MNAAGNQLESPEARATCNDVVVADAAQDEVRLTRVYQHIMVDTPCLDIIAVLQNSTRLLVTPPGMPSVVVAKSIDMGAAGFPTGVLRCLGQS
jgi:hypothetical protein